MNPIERAWSLAETLGGKTGLNCVAELYPSVLECIGAREERCKTDLPLNGIPVLIKDNIDVKGLHTTAGSLALEDNIAQTDAPIVRNLKKNGAVILGKTNMTEFANYVTQGMPGGYSSRGGQVIHAIDPSINPSGSSSGSAVAVSAGIVPMAVGTDTSFSIIACAQVNGICGLKPPIGALSSEGIIPIARTLDSAGPMARNMSDALKLYSAMRDEPLPVLKPSRTERLRIAVNRANEEKVSPGQSLFLKDFLKNMKAEGTQLSEITQMPCPEMMTIMKWEFKPMLEEYLSCTTVSRKTLAEIVEYYESNPTTMMRYGDIYLREALYETPGGLNGTPYLDAMKIRGKTIAEVSREIREYDAVIMTGPTTVMHFCGLPSVTVAGNRKTENGVRRAVIMYGKDEYRLYEAALAIEQVLLRMA